MFGTLAKYMVIGVSALLTGCTLLPMQHHAPDEDEVTMGSRPRRNFTPLEPAFACMADTIRQKAKPAVSIGVGDIKDYTGKYSQAEGSTITQGGTLMVYSALGKLGNVVQVHERFDTRIAELELAYTDKRQLGDGRTHPVEAGKPPVPWIPYFGGSILRSQYYIVGGITEVNHNIQSGGGEFGVNGVGVKRRTYTMNVGVDMRIVDTRTLLVVKTVSMQKQIKGHELGGSVYRFFGTDLLDINVGAKNQEPLQLGVRTTIEQGVLELIAAVNGVEADDCIARALETRDGVEQVAQAAPVAAAPAAARAAPAKTNGNGNGNAAKPADAPVIDPAATQSGLPPQNSGTGSQSGAPQILFEFGSAAMSTQAMSQIEQLAIQAGQGQSITFHLVGRDNEVYSPSQRRELSNQRIRAITDALAARGISGSRIGVTWLPEPTDASIVRHGAGYQLLATMVISR